MSLIEKLFIRNTVNSENYLNKYFIGIFLYFFILLVLLLINVFSPGQVVRILIYAQTAFIIIHTLFLAPSLISLISARKRSGPIWEKAVTVCLSNLALIVVALTFSSYVFHNM